MIKIIVLNVRINVYQQFTKSMSRRHNNIQKYKSIPFGFVQRVPELETNRALGFPLTECLWIVTWQLKTLQFYPFQIEPEQWHHVLWSWAWWLVVGLQKAVRNLKQTPIERYRTSKSLRSSRLTVRVYTANEIFAETHGIERGEYFDIFAGFELNVRQIVSQRTRLSAAHFVTSKLPFHSTTISSRSTAKREQISEKQRKPGTWRTWQKTRTERITVYIQRRWKLWRKF